MKRTLLATVAVFFGLAGPASAGYDVVHQKYLPVKNSAGQSISVDLWLPAKGTQPLTGRWPVIIEESPYRDWQTPYPAKQDNPSNGGNPTEWVQRGYVYVFADVPGTGGSEGTWCLWCPAEVDSAVSILEWAAGQPWSNGHVGWYGNSYPGILGLLVAERHPPHLDTVRIGQPYGDLYEDFAYIGGIQRGTDMQFLAGGFTGLDRYTGPYCVPGAQCPADAWANAWTQREARPPAQFLQDFLSRRTNDAWYHERSVLDHIDRVEVPTLLMAGWEDMFGRATARVFDAIRPGVPKRLVMGASTHVPLQPAGDDINVKAGEEQRWFDRWLRGTPANTVPAQTPVRLFTEQGPGWRSFTTWPPATERPQTLYLGDATLQPTPPAPGSDSRTIDPNSGHAGGFWLFRVAVPDSPQEYFYPDQPGDQNTEAPSVITYQTPPLTHDVELTGRPRAILRASTTATDTQLNVRLIDDHPDGTPDGYAYLVTSGWRLASHRASDTQPTPPEPGKPFDATVDLFPLSYVFKKGHRIRVDIAFADSPRMTAPTASGATTILRGTSRIELPVVGEALPAAGGCADRLAPRVSRHVKRARSRAARTGQIAWVLRGTALDRGCAGIARIEVRTTATGRFHRVHGTRRWQARVSAGTRVAAVRAVDRAGNVSRAITIRLVRRRR